MDAAAPPIKLPIRIVRVAEGYCLEDAAGYRFAHTYAEDEPGRRSATGRKTHAETRALMQWIARALTDRAAAGSSGSSPS